LAVDAAALNPPFSCRGSSRVVNDVLGTKVASSVAMAFVLRAFERLGMTGQLAVLLPAGCLLGEKDEDAWRMLYAHAIVTVVKEFGRGEFNGAFARTVLVHLRRRSPGTVEGQILASECGSPSKQSILTLHRGRFPVHCVTGGRTGFRLVHTTQLRDGTVIRPSEGRGPAHLSLKGPLLLVPRVGLPSARKIALYLAAQRIVVSDCVFAVSGPRSSLENIQRRILHRWDFFRSRYGGSCAPYITTRRLLAVLRELGVDVQLEHRLERLVKERALS
jgi:hypothetical protein